MQSANPTVTIPTLCFLVLFFLLASLSRASSWSGGANLHTASTYAEYPNPVTNPGACGRAHSQQSWICDPDNVLSENEANALEGALAGIYQVPTQTCKHKQGYQVAIALVDWMKKYGYSNTLSDAQRFAKDLHDTWGVGFEDCQNGIVMFLALGDRHMYISTGSEARKILTDSLAAEVIDRMKPHLKAGHYYGALDKGLQDIKDILLHGQISWSFQDYVGAVLITLFIVFLGGGFMYQLILGCVGQMRYGACKKKLSKIEKKRANELSKKFKSTHCPICLEDFPTDKRKVEVLRCGHKFCKSCLAEWQQRSPTCPVCRDRDEKASGEREVYNSETSTVPFELEMLRRQYPMYIQPSTVARWSSPSFRGSFVTDSSFVSASPAISSSSSSTSRESSSSHWGGGSSGDGGGAGGSW